MDYRKFFLYFALAIVSLMIWHAWEQDYPRQQPAPAATTEQTASTTAEQQSAAPIAPVLPEAKNKPHTQTPVTNTASNDLITVSTDTLTLKIDRKGGNIVSAELPAYPESLEDKTPVSLFSMQQGVFYAAQSGLIQRQSSAGDTPTYTASAQRYQLEAGQDELKVNLTATYPGGAKVTKTYTLNRGSYSIGLSYTIDNATAKPWQGHMYTQFQRQYDGKQTSNFLHNYFGFFGAAISSPDKPYEKLSFKKLGKENIDRLVAGGWAAMIQHYFVAAWVPDSNSQQHYYSRVDNGDIYTVGFMGPELLVQPGQTQTLGATLYAGPKITSKLEQVAPHLDLTIDFGWLWFISVAIFWLMNKIHALLGNWGWAIVIVTMLIKVVFYRLSATSYRSMAKMRQLQPKLTALKERFGDDKQKFSQATFDLYRKEKVNPLGGCLPILVQIPVFIALYWVLIESVELRQAPFMLWIQDLSVHDPYYVLPVLMGLTMFIQQKLSPPPPDPMQAKMMMLLPVVFTVFFLKFPAGLVLYWLVNNTLSILQQWYITHKFEHELKQKKANAR